MMLLVVIININESVSVAADELQPAAVPIVEGYHVLVLQLHAHVVVGAQGPDVRLVVLVRAQKEEHFQLLRYVRGTFLRQQDLFYRTRLRLRLLLHLFDWLYFGLGLELNYRRPELFRELRCKSVEFLAKLLAGPLEGIVSEDVVGDSYEDLFDVVNKLVQLIVFGLPEFFLYFGEGGWVLGDVAEVVDAEFGYFLDFEEGFDVGFVLDVGEEAPDAIVLVAAVQFHAIIVQNE